MTLFVVNVEKLNVQWRKKSQENDLHLLHLEACKQFAFMLRFKTLSARDRNCEFREMVEKWSSGWEFFSTLLNLNACQPRYNWSYLYWLIVKTRCMNCQKWQTGTHFLHAGFLFLDCSSRISRWDQIHWILDDKTWINTCYIIGHRFELKYFS